MVASPLPIVAGSREPPLAPNENKRAPTGLCLDFSQGTGKDPTPLAFVAKKVIFAAR